MRLPSLLDRHGIGRVRHAAPPPQDGRLLRHGDPPRILKRIHQEHLVTESSESGETQAAREQQAAMSVPARPMSVWARLKEHKVAQWTLAYAAAAYAVLHGTEMVSNAFEWQLAQAVQIVKA